MANFFSKNDIPEDSETLHDEAEDIKSSLLKRPVALTITVSVTICVAGLLIGLVLGFPIEGLAFSAPIALGYAIVAWRFYDPIDPDKMGVVILLGEPVEVRGSGPPYLPVGFFSVEQLPIRFNQSEFPAEPEKRYKGGMKERTDLPTGMKPAIRQVFEKAIEGKDEACDIYGKDYEVLDLHKCELPDEVNHWGELSLRKLEEMEVEKQDDTQKYPTVEFKAYSSDDGLHGRVTAELVFVVRWRVEQEEAIEFFRNVGSVAEADRQMEDEMVSVTSRLLPHMSAGQAIRNIAWINAHLFFAVIKRTQNWGVRIDSAYVKQIELHHDLNDKIAEAAEARFIAMAEKTKIVAIGEANAKAARMLEEQTLSGRAAGLKQVANDLGISGAEAQAAEVATKISSSGNTIVLGVDSLKEAAGAAGAFLKEGGKKK